MKREIVPPAFITPLHLTFPLRGEDIVVTAASTVQLGEMLQLLSPVLHELVALPADTLERLASDQGPTQADVLLVLTLLSDQPGLPVKLVAVATGLAPAKVGGYRADEFAFLFAVVLQVNADFFARALPVFMAAAERLAALVPAKAKAKAQTEAVAPAALAAATAQTAGLSSSTS